MRSLCVVLCCVVMQPRVPAQISGKPADESANAKLNMTVIRGDGTLNNVRKRAMSEIAVQLKDAAGGSVGGAAVSFILPTQGASGAFSNGSQSITVQSDSVGIAAVRFKPNSATGRVEIRASALHAGQTARAVITQSNMIVPRAGGSTGKVVAILTILGGAAGGAVAYTRSKRDAASSPAAPPSRPAPIVITPGPGTAGPPF